MMKKICICFYVLLFSLSYTFAQKNTFLYKGSIVDSSTNAVLQNVRIFVISNGDTLKTTSNSAGQFQVTALINAKLHFRKAGYAWQSLGIKDRNMQKIYLVPSKSLCEKDIGKENYDRVTVLYDGHVVPQNEWDDVASINKDEIESLEIQTKNGKTIISFTSKL